MASDDSQGVGGGSWRVGGSACEGARCGPVYRLNQFDQFAGREKSIINNVQRPHGLRNDHTGGGVFL